MGRPDRRTELLRYAQPPSCPVMRPISFFSVLAATAVATTALAQSARPPLDSATVAGFRWRTVGPANFEGRVADVVGIPSPSKTFFVATAGGGIWKTTNAGTTFRPVFEDYPVVAMGALAAVTGLAGFVAINSVAATTLSKRESPENR